MALLNSLVVKLMCLCTCKRARLVIIKSQVLPVRLKPLVGRFSTLVDMENHMDDGLMRRLCLAYLAAGNQTMAFWSWNHRPGGWEQGEYGMIGLSGEVMPWAHTAGRIAQAMDCWRDELWDDHETCSVGVVESWDTDAVLYRELARHRDDDGIPGDLHGGTASMHRLALVGAGRADSCTN